MKIVISPAKSLDFETETPSDFYSDPIFIQKSERIQNTLKQKSPKELSDLMNISANLANLNWQRNQDWSYPFTLENSRQALYAFKGDVYQGLDAYTIATTKIPMLQDKVRILSGLYGILKPFDLIQPYRLEMGTKLEVGTHKNLYDFWGNYITESLNHELNDGDVLINLASNEYFKAIKPKELKAEIITPVFKDYKNGKLKVISFNAKKARGMMVRYIIENHVEQPCDLKNFTEGGYAYDENLSSDKEFVFTK
ncbi:peroxide stress protein YaaA [Aureivirga sp. CE67]|uniref:peroxide stress protein YaaA n=1 Tax=Aureivirga sp. CE67 TaxID=1788983 RepID=UPI0018CA0981|nr:peroxide stress protein YaaA [Aureivirga sp. CE67]